MGSTQIWFRRNATAVIIFGDDQIHSVRVGRRACSAADRKSSGDNWFRRYKYINIEFILYSSDAMAHQFWVNRLNAFARVSCEFSIISLMREIFGGSAADAFRESATIVRWVSLSNATNLCRTHGLEIELEKSLAKETAVRGRKESRSFFYSRTNANDEWNLHFSFDSFLFVYWEICCLWNDETNSRALLAIKSMPDLRSFRIVW